MLTGTEESLSLSWQLVGVLVAVVAASVGVTTLVFSRRDRSRAHAALVSVVHDGFLHRDADGPLSGDPERVPRAHLTVRNGGAEPIEAVSVAIFDWGRRKRTWRLRAPEDVWTGTRIAGRHFSMIRPDSESEMVDLPGASTPPSRAFELRPPPVIIRFDDGSGRRWVRWPDRKLSRVWFERRG